MGVDLRHDDDAKITRNGRSTPSAAELRNRSPSMSVLHGEGRAIPILQEWYSDSSRESPDLQLGLTSYLNGARAGRNFDGRICIPHQLTALISPSGDLRDDPAMALRPPSSSSTRAVDAGAAKSTG